MDHCLNDGKCLIRSLSIREDEGEGTSSGGKPTPGESGIKSPHDYEDDEEGEDEEEDEESEDDDGEDVTLWESFFLVLLSRYINTTPDAVEDLYNFRESTSPEDQRIRKMYRDAVRSMADSSTGAREMLGYLVVLFGMNIISEDERKSLILHNVEITDDCIGLLLKLVNAYLPKFTAGLDSVKVKDNSHFLELTCERLSSIILAGYVDKDLDFGKFWNFMAHMDLKSLYRELPGCTLKVKGDTRVFKNCLEVTRVNHIEFPRKVAIAESQIDVLRILQQLGL